MKTKNKGNLTFWEYLKTKLWIILIVDVYIVFFYIPISFNAESIVLFFTMILMNLVWIGMFYLFYKGKAKEKLKKRRESRRRYEERVRKPARSKIRKEKEDNKYY